MNEILIEKQNSTIENLNELLSKYGKGIFVRPTGFGKTYLFMEKIAKAFIKSNKGKGVLYVYPLDIIKTETIRGKVVIKEDDNGHKKKVIKPNKYFEDKVLKLDNGNIDKDRKRDGNIEFISYQKLSLMYNEDENYWREYIQNREIGMILLDEAHRAGAEKLYDVYDTFKDLIGPDGIRLVGATATPFRLDDAEHGTDVIERIFDNHQTYAYSLIDAIEDGIMLKPVVMSTRESFEKQTKEIREQYKRNNKDFKKMEAAYSAAMTKQWKEIGDNTRVVASSIRKAGYDISKDRYYKFIVFFSNYNDMVEKSEDMISMFKAAFNEILVVENGLRRKFDFRIRYVMSDDSAGELHKLCELADSKGDERIYLNKVDKLEELINTDYTVDLIFTRDMVNMGYHVEDITGVVLKRASESEIVYYQQIGRAFSVTSKFRAIIIDFVNNVGRDRSNKDKREANEKGNINGEEISGDNDRDDSIRRLIDAVISENTSAFTRRFNGVDNSEEKYMLEYMYLDRKMPINIVAAALKRSCKEIVKLLAKYNIKVHTEDKYYEMLNSMCENAYETIKLNNKDESNKEAFDVYKKLLRTTNSRHATYSGECKFINNKQEPCLYDIINKK